jgi:hypothetical protein
VGFVARKATEEATRRLAEDLLAEDQPTRLRPLLRFFQQRAFPLNPDCLLALTGHADPEIAEQALRTLRHVQHPEMRPLALTFLRARIHVTAAASLLQRRVQPGDEVMLSEVMLDLEAAGNDVELHGFVSVFTDLAQAQPSPALHDLLSKSFEHQPCSVCRKDMVQLLQQSGALPEWLAAEARLDVNDDLRELVDRNPEQAR